MEPIKRLNASKVARELDISVATLNNWYRWYNDPQFEKPPLTPALPLYQVKIKFVDGAPLGWSRRSWAPCDLIALRIFKEWLPRGRNGVMGAYSKRFWGDKTKKESL